MVIRILFLVLLVVVSLLSLAAGAAKIMMAEPEIAFFSALGLDPRWMLPLGALQIAGPVLAVFKRWRIIAAALMATGFAISAVMILLSGNAGFAAISAVPVLLALLAMIGARRMR